MRVIHTSRTVGGAICEQSMQIKHRHTGDVICEGETAAAAVAESSADLSFADFSSAYISFQSRKETAACAH